MTPSLRRSLRPPLGAPWTPEQLAELNRDMADIAAGKAQLIPHEELPAWLEQQARERGEFNE